ncbi:AarF/UbiB family protein [Streptomyces tubercidicus]
MSPGRLPLTQGQPLSTVRRVDFSPTLARAWRARSTASPMRGHRGSKLRTPSRTCLFAIEHVPAPRLCALDELRALQDNRRSMPTTSVGHQPGRSYGRRFTDVFGSFDPHLVASASITQVRRAPLKEDAPVAMKVVKRALCTQHDIPLVSDEVVPGFRVAYEGVQTLTSIAPASLHWATSLAVDCPAEPSSKRRGWPSTAAPPVNRSARLTAHSAKCGR